METYRDRGPGFCDDCGRPIYHPQFQRPGYMGCQCETPAMVTWQEMDAVIDQTERPAPKQAGHVRPTNFSIWKKRAKNL